MSGCTSRTISPSCSLHLNSTCTPKSGLLNQRVKEECAFSRAYKFPSKWLYHFTFVPQTCEHALTFEYSATFLDFCWSRYFFNKTATSPSLVGWPYTGDAAWAPEAQSPLACSTWGSRAFPHVGCSSLLTMVKLCLASIPFQGQVTLNN